MCTPYSRTEVPGGYYPPSRPFGMSGTPLHPVGCRTAERSLPNLSIAINFKPSPFDHNMAKLYEEVEACIKEAIAFISNRENTISIPEVAEKFDVPLRRLRNRLNGVPSKIGHVGTNRKLSEAEEDALCGYVDRLDKLGLPIRPRMLESTANIILSRNHTGEDSPPVVGTKWVSRFLQRHSEYSVRKQKMTDPRRTLASNATSVEAWYDDFLFVYQEYGIQPSDLWNMDESGFQIGMGKHQKVVTRDASKPLYSGSSTNRELITMIESISTGGETIPPMVVLKGKQLQERWFDCTSIDDDTAIVVSDSGFSNDELIFEWLKHFNKWSAKSQVGMWWMLLLDGRGSHCTYEFLNYCESETVNIIVYCLPSHTTHFLQPLDVVIFQPYKHWHAEAIDEATRTGCEDFNKLEFLKALGSI